LDRIAPDNDRGVTQNLVCWSPSFEEGREAREELGALQSFDLRGFLFLRRGVRQFLVDPDRLVIGGVQLGGKGGIFDD
jgi:hypothetical protein